jgi:hypothetical protein
MNFAFHPYEYNDTGGDCNQILAILNWFRPFFLAWRAA